MAANGPSTFCDRYKFPYATFHNGEIVARLCYGVDALSLACALGIGAEVWRAGKLAFVVPPGFTAAAALAAVRRIWED